MKRTIISLLTCTTITANLSFAQEIGSERAVPDRLRDGDEYQIPITKLIDYGRTVFSAMWTREEGAGRPLTKGNGAPLADPHNPLVFPKGFNRVSGPDANSCAGCHNSPFGVSGGSGDIVGNVFVLANRFDFATFDHNDLAPTKGAVDEQGNFVTQRTIGNSRKTIGMFGSGFVEMLARQITSDLQSIRDSVMPGGARALTSKGISFGVIARRMDGTWDTSRVEGIPNPSLVSSDAGHPPSLIIRPFHQAGNVISLRQFTNTAFSQHHGMQSTERFGLNADPDGDSITNELNRADITAATLFQATMPVPKRVIPKKSAMAVAITAGEANFSSIGCASCHIPSLTLDKKGWIYTEPNPYNPPGNLTPADMPVIAVDLTSNDLPPPRLKLHHGVVQVPVFTDFKLHDITDGPHDPNREALDMNEPASSPSFFAGNAKFLTRKLWGAGNQGPYFHHGQYTTLKEAILAHGGEAAFTRQAFLNLGSYEQGSIIEFLKSMQVLSPAVEHKE